LRDTQPRMLLAVYFLTILGLDPNAMGRDIGVLAGMAVFYLILAYLALRFVKKAKN